MAKPGADADQTQQRRHHILPRAYPLLRRRVQKYCDARDVRRNRGLRSQSESLDDARPGSNGTSCARGRHGARHRVFYRRQQRLRRRRSVQSGLQFSSSMRPSVESLVRRSLPALFLSVSLIACTTPARDDRTDGAPPALNDLTSFALLRIDQASRTSAPLSVDQLADALKDYDVVFFGEWHDHPGNHLAEMALFRAIHQRSPQLALSLEQFERDVQPVLDDYMAGRIGEEALQRRGRAWNNYPESYRPLVEYAKESALAVIAAEAPTRLVRCVGQEGPEFLARLRPEQRNWAAAELHLAGGAYRDKFFRFLDED